MKSKFDVLARNEDNNFYKWKKYPMTTATKYLWDRFDYTEDRKYTNYYSPAMVLDDDYYAFKQYDIKYHLKGYYNLRKEIPAKYTYIIQTVVGFNNNGSPVWNTAQKTNVDYATYLTDAYMVENQMKLDGTGWNKYYMGYKTITIISYDFEDNDLSQYYDVIKSYGGSYYNGIHGLAQCKTDYSITDFGKVKGPIETGTDNYQNTWKVKLYRTGGYTDILTTNDWYVGLDIWFECDSYTKRKSRIGDISSVSLNNLVAYIQNYNTIDKIADCTTLYPNNVSASEHSAYLRPGTKETYKAEGGFDTVGGKVYWATDKMHSGKTWKEMFSEYYGYRKPKSQQSAPYTGYVDLFAGHGDSFYHVKQLLFDKYMMFSRDSTRANKLLLLEYEYYDDVYGPAGGYSGDNSYEIAHYKLMIPVKIVPYDTDSEVKYEYKGQMTNIDNKKVFSYLTTKLGLTTTNEINDEDSFTVAQADTYIRLLDSGEWSYATSNDFILKANPIVNDYDNVVKIANGSIVPAIICLQAKPNPSAYPIIHDYPNANAISDPYGIGGEYQNQKIYDYLITYEPDLRCYLDKKEPFFGFKYIDAWYNTEINHAQAWYCHAERTPYVTSSNVRFWHDYTDINKIEDYIPLTTLFPKKRIVDAPTEGRLVNDGTIGYYYVPVEGKIWNAGWDVFHEVWTGRDTELGEVGFWGKENGRVYTNIGNIFPDGSWEPFGEILSLRFRKILTCWESATLTETTYTPTNKIGTVSSFNIDEYPVDSEEPYNGYYYKYVGSVEVQVFDENNSYSEVYSVNKDAYPMSGVAIENGEWYWYQYSGYNEYVINSYTTNTLLSNIQYAQSIGNTEHFSIGVIGGATAEFDVWRPLVEVIPYYNMWGNLYYSFQNDNQYLHFGRFKIKELSENGIDKTHVIAYDSVHLLDKPAKELLDNLTYPITAYKLFIQICNYCEIPYKMTTDFINSNAELNATIDKDDITCRDIMEYIAQIAGCCITADLEGYLVFKNFLRPSKSRGSIQSNTFNLNSTMLPIQLPNCVQYKENNEIQIVAINNYIQEQFAFDLVDNPFMTPAHSESIAAELIHLFRGIGTIYSWDAGYDTNFYGMSCGDSWVVSTDDIGPRRGIITSIQIDSSGVNFASSGEIQTIKKYETPVEDLQESIARLNSTFITIPVKYIDVYDYWSNSFLYTIELETDYIFSQDNLTYYNETYDLYFSLLDQFFNLANGVEDVPVVINGQLSSVNYDEEIDGRQKVLTIKAGDRWPFTEVRLFKCHDMISDETYIYNPTLMWQNLDYNDYNFIIDNFITDNPRVQEYITNERFDTVYKKLGAVIGYLTSTNTYNISFEYRKIFPPYDRYYYHSDITVITMVIQNGGSSLRLPLNGNYVRYFLQQYITISNVEIVGTDLVFTCTHPQPKTATFTLASNFPSTITTNGYEFTDITLTGAYWTRSGDAARSYSIDDIQLNIFNDNNVVNERASNPRYMYFYLEGKYNNQRSYIASFLYRYSSTAQAYVFVRQSWEVMFSVPTGFNVLLDVNSVITTDNNDVVEIGYGGHE